MMNTFNLSARCELIRDTKQTNKDVLVPERYALNNHKMGDSSLKPGPHKIC
jgi:hypothetical protein